MKIIPRNSKILSISHIDLDGSVSQIVLGHVYKNITYIDTSFYKIDSVVQSIDYSQYDYVFLTDICTTEGYLLDISDKIVVLDHHESSSSINNPSKMRFIISGMCGAKLTKRFVETMYGIHLKELDELVYLTNDYDMWIHENPKSTQLNDLMFYKYRPAAFRRLYFDGHTNFTMEELDWLQSRVKQFENMYDKLEIFDFDEIRACITYAPEFINEICHKLMNEEKYDIVFLRNPRNGRVSIRTIYKNINIGEMLKSHGWGGGHAQSAGMFVDSLDDFGKKCQTLVIEIKNILDKGDSK